jgi:hypothetical protein
MTEVTVMVAVRLTPAAEAVMVAVVVPETDPAVAVKVLLLDPEATVTVAGTVTAAWSDDRLTVKAEVAALVSDTVQVEIPPGLSVVGRQLRDERATGAVNPSENVRETPLRVAVKVALVSVETAAAVAVNVAVVNPALTVTEAGTVTEALLLDRLTLAPPAGAAAVRVTVQVLVPGVTTEAGVQLRLAGCGRVMVTVPPAVITAIGSPPGVVPSAPAICTVDDVLLVVGETVNVAVATTPEAMAVVFSPVTRQIIEPPPPLQATDLSAALAAGPVLTVSPEKSAAE